MFEDLCIISPGSDRNVKKKKTLHIWGKWERIPGPSFCLDPHQKLTGFCSGPRSKFCGKYAQCFFVFFVCVCDKNTNNQQWQTTQNKQTDKQTNRHGWQHNLTGGGNKHIHLLPLSSLVLSHPYRAGRGSRNGAKIFSSQLLTPTFLHFWTATNPCMWFADSGHRSLTWMHF